MELDSLALLLLVGGATFLGSVCLVGFVSSVLDDTSTFPTLRRKADRVFSATDAYGDTVQLFHMPNGETLECTTDLGGEPPLFWCDGAAHKKYLR